MDGSLKKVGNAIKTAQLKHKVAAAVGGVGVIAASVFTAIYEKCPTEGAVVETIVSVYAGHLECGNYSAMADDIGDLCDEFDFCGDWKAQDPDVVEKLPSGQFSVAAAACLTALPKVASLMARGKIPESWGCKKDELDPALLDEACRRL